MRILHSSDWHLGQSFHAFERVDEHRRFLAWLLDTLETEKIDALLVAGDVFDTANPSAASQRQLYEFLHRAKVRVPHLKVVLIAGNHDSPGRLEAPSALLEALGVSVVGHVSHTSEAQIDLERLVIPLEDGKGRVGAWCIAIPFLRPGDVPRVEAESDAFSAGVTELYRRAFASALARREPGQAILAMGHSHMVGGRVSELSERRVLVGGSEAMSTSAFDSRIAYVALGHLHLAQKIGDGERIRYCGSPLPMSFAEVDYPHQVVIFDVEGADIGDLRSIRVPRFVELLRIPEHQAASIGEVLSALEALELPDRPLEEQPYLQVRVRLDAPEPGLRARIDDALAGKPVRLANIETRYAASSGGADSSEPLRSIDDLARLEPQDIFQRLYRRKYESDPSEALMTAFAELLIAAADEEAR